jgi:hypothetical protein
MFEHFFQFPLEVGAGSLLSHLRGHRIEDAVDVRADLI